ncbi:MAG: hypothetical protein KME16_11010 [Scytolyngbya sp. HA4215-MV1]|nr:hypothetical protein [Scytolyngbya sp. HA4215-MV1]
MTTRFQDRASRGLTSGQNASPEMLHQLRSWSLEAEAQIEGKIGNSLA